MNVKYQPQIISLSRAPDILSTNITPPVNMVGKKKQQLKNENNVTQTVTQATQKKILATEICGREFEIIEGQDRMQSMPALLL